MESNKGGEETMLSFIETEGALKFIEEGDLTLNSVVFNFEGPEGEHEIKLEASPLIAEFKGEMDLLRRIEGALHTHRRELLVKGMDILKALYESHDSQGEEEEEEMEVKVPYTCQHSK